MGYQVIRRPLWVESKDIQPGVKVLSGPFDLSQISKEAPDMHITYCTTLAVESKLKKTNDPEYSNVEEDIMKRFKELIGQYPTAFVLSGSPLGAVKGF
ncbi:hypothetical protein ACROYT_G025282 [Oculina patagonica]